MDDLLSIAQADAIRADLGREGERLAADFLEKNGYRLVMSNFKVPLGRNSRGAEVTGEIDLIAVDNETLCFVEVKTRRSDELFEPAASVTLRKQRQITRTAKVYRRIFNVSAMPYRYDVVSIVLPYGGTPVIELSREFWTDARFKKRNWHYDLYDDFI